MCQWLPLLRNRRGELLSPPAHLANAQAPSGPRWRCRGVKLGEDLEDRYPRIYHLCKIGRFLCVVGFAMTFLI